MQRRWKAAAVLVATFSVGAIGVTQASASSLNEIAYNKGDAEFCASHMDGIYLSQKNGSSGNCVRVLQSLLLKENPTWKSFLKVDGDFGPMTDKAERRWEQEHSSKVDGIVNANNFTFLARINTTPAGKAHITGVVTNASTNTRKPSSGGSGGGGGSSTPAKLKSSPVQTGVRQGTNVPAQKQAPANAAAQNAVNVANDLANLASTQNRKQ
jgi:peptidoglycan hydrolase-like protein with peptidoglycan-binding domain